MSTQPQSRAEVRHLLERAGIRPHRLRGQNFLVDAQAMRAVVEAAALTRDDFVLEVGTGTAGLTVLLAERAGAILTVEVDPKLQQVAREVLRGRQECLPHRDDVGQECPTSCDSPGERPTSCGPARERPAPADRRTDLPACPERREETPTLCPVEMLLADVLAGKHEIEPEVMRRLESAAARFARVKLVANLPYSIATPLVINLLLTDAVLERLVFTVQREVAERMTALPGTREYGWVSVLVHLAGGAKIVRNVPPGAFWPAPKVSSALVRIFPRVNWREGIAMDALRRVGPYLFQQRRKTVARILKNFFAAAELDLDAAQILADCRIDTRTRGDQLTPAEVVCIAGRVATRPGTH